MHNIRGRRWILVLLLSAGFCSATAWVRAASDGGAPTEPAQPASGPGSSEAQHKSVTRNVYGSGDTQYWLYEPAEPKPAMAPVIVFMHGWSAMMPIGYQSWIDHLVKRGNIVIYPRYQAEVFSPAVGYTGSAIAALTDAFAELEKEKHVKADLKRVAVVGHSFGGVIAANLAALAAKNNLPVFKAVMCIEPGTGGFAKVYADYSQIPAKTLLITVAGTDDIIVNDTDARRIYKESSNVAQEDKNYIVLISDRHGMPPVLADHFAPTPILNMSNAIRWYGLWKWFDALTDAAFHGKNRNYALGDTAEQRFMGKWSDGQPIAEPKVTTGALK